MVNSQLIYGDREMIKKFLLLIVSVFLLPMLVFGQSSGKIVGVVKDANTGDPLPGVNVVIEGTTLGAASDVDGYFVILNVPVGIYDIKASFIGYKEVTMSGVRVSADITTEVNFDLEEAAIEGEAVVVTATRPLVEKHVTQSVSLVTSEDLENIPVRGFNEVIATQNSVVVQDNNIYIRGGRPDEVGYYIDGASSVDPLTNTQSLYIIQEAVEEFQVLAGGYNAEYGGANSGIIRTELRTGTSDYHFSVDFQTDKFASEGGTFLGTNSYRWHTAVGTFSGPLFSDKIRFFVALENTYKGDRSVRFSEGFTLTNLVDNNEENPKVQNGTPDVVDTYTYPDGFTPQREEDQWALQSTLLFDLSPLQFRLSGSFSDRSRQFNSFYEREQTGNAPNTPMLNVLNDRTFDDQFTNYLITGKLTYILSPTSLLEGTISYFNSKLDRKDSYLGNEWYKWWDSLEVAKATNGEVQYMDRFTPEPNYLFNGFYFARKGAPYRTYRLQKQNYISAALNWNSQIGRHHEVKIGGDLRRYTLRRFVVRPDVINIKLDPDKPLNANNVELVQYVTNSRVNNYGFDIFGNEADSDAFDAATGIQTAEAPKNPQFGSFYVQDKIEYNDLIINAGLRFDYFDTKSKRLKDPEKPAIDPNTKKFKDEAWEDVGAFTQVSPRLGFSFPVSEKTVFYMQYGKFIQMPELETMFAGIHEYNFEYIGSGFAFLNPAGYGLEPVRTTSYEIGFRQQLGTVAAFDIAGFYRNVKGQVQVDQVRPEPQTGLNPFNILVNGDFATTKGLEFSLTLRRINRLQGQLNYTLNRAEGTGSTRTAAVGALEQNAPRPTVINPLDYSQTHRGSINLDYRWGRNEGNAFLQNLGLNLLFTFNSGHPYTFAKSEVGQANAYNAGTDYLLDTRSRRALEPVGHSTTPFVYNFDLKVDKTFNIMKDLQATVYMRVNNLFNTKNVINVYPSTGSPEDDGFLSNRDVSQPFIDANGGEDYVRQYRAINIVNGQAYWDQLGLQLYGHPRQIFFGIKLNY